MVSTHGTDPAAKPQVTVQNRVIARDKMPGIGGLYSHVTDAMRKRLTTDLQRRWTTLTK